MAKSNSVENRQGATAINTSGWSPAVSTNRIVQSLPKPSTRCFNGTGMPPNVMFIYRMCYDLDMVQEIVLKRPGSGCFEGVRGSREARLYKSLLRRSVSTFSVKRDSC